MIIKETDFDATPGQLFDALHDRHYSFFLDSAQPAGGLGAYSFIGFDPFLIFRARGDDIALDRGGRVEKLRGDPLMELRKLFQRYRSPVSALLPFTGGAVGYFSYELGARFENIPRTSPDDLPMPEVEFGFYDALIAVEQSSGRTFVVANPVHCPDAEARARQLEQTVREALSHCPVVPQFYPTTTVTPEPRANFSKKDYLAAIVRIKDYIAAGDVYQVNLTQRFETPLPCHPGVLYQRLRRRSPAPFATYLNFGPMQVVSSSPERFLRLHDGRVETRPIKGTRARGATPAEDEQRGRELSMSGKDRAELLMIVDLERNDLGRVCDYGSIHVDELYRLEAHPTVFHLVATVSGKLRSGCDVFDCLRAAFPGGSITGAPKIRAMQIVDEIETRRRHLYTGSIGYLGFGGNCDLNIAIRTIVCLGGRAYYHVGGGIVWDSDPESEYQETLDKGLAMHAALTQSE
ncbi:MAG TPA: aminodeoxychorismate synthase component I [Opitutaceae bacterium]|jgi:para-aminobenzoate synthetase component 1|nr:aminodeoxychorismate synthase component I [Opitutaceae bacterium]